MTGSEKKRLKRFGWSKLGERDRRTVLYRKDLPPLLTALIDAFCAARRGRTREDREGEQPPAGDEKS